MPEIVTKPLSSSAWGLSLPAMGGFRVKSLGFTFLFNPIGLLRLLEGLGFRVMQTQEVGCQALLGSEGKAML